MSIERILKGHDLFRSLDLNLANEITRLSAVKKYSADEIVFTYNDVAGHVYMLMEGAVDLRLPAKPGEFSLVISKIEKGELFGLSPLLDSPRYTATAQCNTATELLAIEARPFRDILKGNALVGFSIMSQVAHIYFNRYIDVLKSLQGVVSQISMIR